MINLPENCLRENEDCSPFSQIASDEDPITFICMGVCNNPQNREVETDSFTKCIKSLSMDSTDYCDERDLIDEMSVIAQGLSVIANIKANHE